MLRKDRRPPGGANILFDRTPKKKEKKEREINRKKWFTGCASINMPMHIVLKTTASSHFSADNNFIYAVGGEDENRNRLDSVERYDPRYNRWTHITNMPSGAKVSS